MVESECKGLVGLSLDIFVIVKAVVLIYFSIHGMIWFIKSKFQRLNMALIVGVLALSCLLVLSELVFRFTNRHLKYRFIDTAIGHWIVFTVFTLMIGFTRRNDAADATFKIRFVFVPIHLLFFSLILCGWLQQNSTFCSEHTYPHIFIW